MQWNAERDSVGTHWGHAPVQIEVVTGTISLPGKWSHAFALDPSGKPTYVDVAVPAAERTLLKLGMSPAIAYRVIR